MPVSALALLALIAGAVSVAEARQDEFAAGSLALLTEDTVGYLRDSLADGEVANWPVALKTYFFRGLYDRSLPDIVLFIPDQDSARIALLHEGEVKTWLRGQQKVWVLVFAEGLPDTWQPSGSTRTDSAFVNISLTTLEFSPDPFLIALVRSLSGGLLTGPQSGSGAESGDTSVSVMFRPINVVTADRHLYVAMQGFDLAPNTRNRLSVWPSSTTPFPRAVSVHQSFGNASGSRFGLSFAGGFTFNANQPSFSDTTITSEGDEVRVSLYVLGHLHLLRPRLPWRRPAIGLFGGTNLIRGGVLHDLVGGLSFQRLLGDLGLVAGYNLLEYERLVAPNDMTLNRRVGTSRRVRFFLGVDFAL